MVKAEVVLSTFKVVASFSTLESTLEIEERAQQRESV